MPRYHNINGEKIQFTEAEEAAWDAEEKEWDNAASARAMATLRQERNQKLQASDWRGISDNTMSDQWKTYRAALRDFPENVDLNNIVWPKEPS